jgi:uncharacterized protein involved in exopolysaccharide biosynthesis
MIQIVDRAHTPDKESAPKRCIYIILGLILGAIFGVMAASFCYAARGTKNAKKIAALKESLGIYPKR